MAFLTDSSTNNFQLSAFGDAALSTTTFKYGSGSAYFDGNGDYLETNDIVLGTDNFTVECWIYPISISGESTIFNQGNSDTTGNFIFSISNGQLLFYANNSSRYFSTATIQNNQWTHIAFSRQNNIYYIFIDGNLDNSVSVTLDHFGLPFKIGDGYGGIRYFNGYIDDFRITKGIARYTANFTPPTQQLPAPSDQYGEDVSLLLHMDGEDGSTDFTDSSLNNFTLTAFGGAQINTSIRKFGSGAAYFDGDGDYIEVSYSPLLDYDLGDFTVEFWVNFSSLTAPGNIIGMVCGSVENAMDINYDNSLSIGVHFITTRHTFPWNPSINTWYHVAVCRADGNTKAFIDGVQIGTTKNDSSFNYSMFDGNMIIGRGDNNTNSFNGYIDELRITKGVARYTENFVPQTAPFANPSFGEWDYILNSTYGSNVIAAYDFRDIEGGSLVGKVGPALTLTSVTEDSNGGIFSYGSSNAVGDSTVNLTYPHTIVFVAKGNFGGGSEIQFFSMSDSQNSGNPQTALFARTSQSIMPYNGTDNQETNYDPDNSEWFYVAASFLNDGNVRYAVRAASGNLNGIVNGSNGDFGFSAYPVFGKWFGGNLSINGTIRLGISINQGFATEQEMNDLFDTFKNGPISDLF
jgi:hypothetical protein